MTFSVVEASYSLKSDRPGIFYGCFLTLSSLSPPNLLSLHKANITSADTWTLLLELNLASQWDAVTGGGGESHRLAVRSKEGGCHHREIWDGGYHVYEIWKEAASLEAATPIYLGHQRREYAMVRREARHAVLRSLQEPWSWEVLLLYASAPAWSLGQMSSCGAEAVEDKGWHTLGCEQLELDDEIPIDGPTIGNKWGINLCLNSCAGATSKMRWKE